MQQHPAATEATLSAVLELFGDDLELENDMAALVLLDEAEQQARQRARAAQAAARMGVAAGLEALAKVLEAPNVRVALDFLVSKGLAEPSDTVREAMVVAGEHHSSSVPALFDRANLYMWVSWQSRLMQ